MAAIRTKKQQRAQFNGERVKAGLRLLRHEILSDLEDQLPEFKIPQLFIVWFLEAKFGVGLDRGKEYVTDGTRDKGVDAVYIDEQNKKVYVIQSKYSNRPSGSQSKEELLHTATIARRLCDPYEDDFRSWLKDARKEVKNLLGEAYERIWDRRYTLEVLFVTCLSVSTSLVRDIRRDFRRIPDARISVISIDEVLQLAEQYFDGEVPAIDEMVLNAVDAGSIIFHEGDKGSLSSYVCKCQCRGFAKQITSSRFPLELFFHRNIRGFLGEQMPVNADISTTLRTEPRLFFYLNNGITILTTGVHKSGAKLTLNQPQIINGQQTSHVLARHSKTISASATVLVRVIVLERTDDYDQVRKLVGKIVKATNWQSAITKADLRSNDPEQIKLQRHMARRGCLYIRKRGPVSQFRPHGRRYRATIRKERLAQAVGACQFDQRVVRSGVDHLFDDDTYPKVFSIDRKVDWYLSRYFTERAVDKAKKHRYKKAAWTYAKWMVVGYVWKAIAPVVSPQGKITATTTRYVDALSYDQGDREIKELMNRISVATFRAAAIFYEEFADGKDESLFFRDQRNLNREFDTFMKQKSNRSRRKRISDWVSNLRSEIKKEI